MSASVVLLLVGGGCGDPDGARAARYERVQGEYVAFVMSVWTLDGFVSALADKDIPDLPGWKEEVGLVWARARGIPPETRDAVVAEWHHMRALMAEPSPGVDHPHMTNAELDRAEANLEAMRRHVARIRVLLEPHRETIQAQSENVLSDGKPADPHFVDRLLGKRSDASHGGGR